MSKTTVLRIARPASGPVSNWEAARTAAKNRNAAQGRGHRAIKCDDGTFAVIFRPAVASNRQKSVRTLGL